MSERKTHNLKTLSKFFTQIITGVKNFEVRKNDRDYQVGDYVTLHEFNGTEYVGYKSREFVIAYVLTSDDYPDGIMPGYCILGLK